MERSDTTKKFFMNLFLQSLLFLVLYIDGRRGGQKSFGNINSPILRFTLSVSSDTKITRYLSKPKLEAGKELYSCFLWQKQEKTYSQKDLINGMRCTRLP